MTTNPFANRPNKGGKVTEEMLRDLASDLNRMTFVRDSGRLYFVKRRLKPDGIPELYLDRAS